MQRNNYNIKILDLELAVVVDVMVFRFLDLSMQSWTTSNKMRSGFKLLQMLRSVIWSKWTYIMHTFLDLSQYFLIIIRYSSRRN